MKDGEKVELIQGPQAGRAWKLGKEVIEVGERGRAEVGPLGLLTCPVVPQIICWDMHPVPPWELRKAGANLDPWQKSGWDLSAIYPDSLGKC